VQLLYSSSRLVCHRAGSCRPPQPEIEIIERFFPCPDQCPDELPILSSTSMTTVTVTLEAADGRAESLATKVLASESESEVTASISGRLTQAV
jgi:hypothetical protein